MLGITCSVKPGSILQRRRYILDMHVSVDRSKIEIAMPGDDGWVERIGKTTNEILLIIQQYNRIKLNDYRFC
jgi:hypothetical protein